MKLLVLVEAYPSNNSGAMAFVHTRCTEYLECDKTVELCVLSFQAKDEYTIDGIRVIPCSSFEKLADSRDFDILISHAPNLKHHLRFIKKYEKRFHDIIFVFHGHETLRIMNYYPAPYAFVQNRTAFKRLMQNAYDSVKLLILRRTILQLRKKDKLHLIFVSNWIKEQFYKNIVIEKDSLDHISCVIYNSIQKGFEQDFYRIDAPKKYDFITIRANLDGSKYGIDLICRLAENNPDLSFLVYGKGNYFQHNHKPDNLELRQAYLSPREMIPVLNECKCALMLSKFDTQGVMSCEMASFGMPLITSELPVFHEIFKDFDTVQFISNDDPGKNLKAMLENRKHLNRRIRTFYREQTIQKELEFYRKIIEEQSGKQN